MEMPQAAIAQIIELSDEDLSGLMVAASYCKLKKGEPLLKEGEVCRSFYLIEKGYLRTYYNKEGAIINLNFTFEGNFTSNLKSMRSKQPSEIVIEAGEETLVWVFNLNQLTAHFNTHSQIARFIRRLAIRTLLASEEHSDMCRINTPTERYHYIEKNKPELLQRVPLSQIASYLGVTRETLSRIRGNTY